MLVVLKLTNLRPIVCLFYPPPPPPHLISISTDPQKGKRLNKDLKSHLGIKIWTSCSKGCTLILITDHGNPISVYFEISFRNAIHNILRHKIATLAQILLHNYYGLYLWTHINSMMMQNWNKFVSWFFFEQVTKREGICQEKELPVSNN